MFRDSLLDLTQINGWLSGKAAPLEPGALDADKGVLEVGGWGEVGGGLTGCACLRSVSCCAEGRPQHSPSTLQPSRPTLNP
jgi:hypothetical protein